MIYLSNCVKEKKKLNSSVVNMKKTRLFTSRKWNSRKCKSNSSNNNWKKLVKLMIVWSKPWVPLIATPLTFSLMVVVVKKKVKNCSTLRISTRRK
jgi:hypothetical protein